MNLKIIFFLTFCVVLTVRCTKKKLVKEKVSYSMNVINDDSSINSYNTTFFFIKCSKIIVIELPFRQTFQVDKRMISDSVTYELFVFKIDEKDGYLLKNYNDSFNTKKEVQQFLGSRIVYGDNYYSIFALKKPIKISNKENKQFSLSFNGHHAEIDSFKVYFDDRLSDLNYPLAPKMDSAYKSKLVKIVFWRNTKGYFSDKALETPLTISLELSREKINNEIEIWNLINRFPKS